MVASTIVMMDVVLTLLASVPAVLVTWAVARWCAERQRRFFDMAVDRHGRPSRQPSVVKLGLGLDEMSVGTWDLMPAWRALGTKDLDPDLDALRHSAQVATRVYLILLPASVVPVIASAVLFRVFPFVPAIIAFFAWAVLQNVAFRYSLYFSRPEMGELQRDWGRLLGMLVLIVVALLLICFAVVGLALFIRG